MEPRPEKGHWPPQNTYTLCVKVFFFDEQNDIPVASSSVEKTILEILEFEQVECEEVSLHLVTKERISDLHLQFFNDPAPTDCISFPLDDEGTPNRILGEVFVCPSIAKEYAVRHRGDPYTETTLYLIHGLLHLCGYDDLDPASKKEMRAAEKRHLAHLRKKNLLLK